MYHKTTILANFALARIIKYNRRVVNYDHKECCKLTIIIYHRITFTAQGRLLFLILRGNRVVLALDVFTCFLL